MHALSPNSSVIVTEVTVAHLPGWREGNAVLGLPVRHWILHETDGKGSCLHRYEANKRHKKCHDPFALHEGGTKMLHLHICCVPWFGLGGSPASPYSYNKEEQEESLGVLLTWLLTLSTQKTAQVKQASLLAADEPPTHGMLPAAANYIITIHSIGVAGLPQQADKVTHNTAGHTPHAGNAKHTSKHVAVPSLANLTLLSTSQGKVKVVNNLVFL